MLRIKVAFDGKIETWKSPQIAAKPIFEIRPTMFNRVEVWAIWWQKQQTHLISCGNIVKNSLSVERRVVHNHNGIWWQHRNQFMFKPIFKEYRSSRMLIALYRNMAFRRFPINQSADYICALAPLAFGFVVYLDTSFRTGVESSVFPV